MEKALISLNHIQKAFVTSNMKSPIHFFHANGFPAETYKELLSLIDGDIQDPLNVIGKQIPEVREGYQEFKKEYYPNNENLKKAIAVKDIVPGFMKTFKQILQQKYPQAESTFDIELKTYHEDNIETNEELLLKKERLHS